ncbi:MAG: hypothetical protein KBT27_12160, partial [Prevotellaceae bacterium]|nr:hypothetical protein [Candidatus Faecinaster equi]
MKQTKSLLTLFLTAALAVANIAPSWGALSVSPVTTLPDGKYKLANGYWDVTKGKGKFYLVPTYTVETANKNVSTTMKSWIVTKQDDGSYYFFNQENEVYLGFSISGTTYTFMSNSESPLKTYLFKVTDVTSGTDTIKGYKNYVIGCTYTSGVKAPQLSSISGSEETGDGMGSTAVLSATSKKSDTKAVWAFIPVYDYWYKISAVANDNQMGSVYASFDSDSFSASEVTKSFEDTKSTTAYFKAVSEEGYKFDGWFTDPTCSHSANPTTGNYKDEKITVAVSSTSTTKSAPTITTLYAKFSSAAQKSDFAYTWNCGDVIYGDESYSNLVTVHGENTPSYTLTVADETYLTNVVRENNIITSFETKDNVGADQTITLHIYSEGNENYKGIDEDIPVTLRTAPNHLPIFVTSNSQYDLLVKTTTGTISCDAKGVITVTRHYSNDRNMTFAWHGEAKQALFDYHAVSEAGITGTCTITFTWL